MNEFSLIDHYFAVQTEHRQDVVCGIGDDGAIVKVPLNQELVITTDTLVSGIHFPVSTSAYDIGYKSLAVNLSDLAAMGATPAWITLALTLPQAEEAWIQGFCDGFFTLANRYRASLIGGDLTHGPLSITVQALGFVPIGAALLRSGAKAGDLIYVTGTLGDAGVALASLQEKLQIPAEHQRYFLERLNRPEPRLIIGEHLRHIATAAIDISDGLAADLGHILAKSQVGAMVYVDKLPCSVELEQSLSLEDAIPFMLNAGDDYELCFTIPTHKQTELEQQLNTLPCRYTCIGEITTKPGLQLSYQDGKMIHVTLNGYQHF